jgi:hypothetical protein
MRYAIIHVELRCRESDLNNLSVYFVPQERRSMGHDVRIDSNKQSVQYYCHAHVFSRHPGCHPDLEFGYADCLVSTLQLWLMHAECTLTKTCSLIIATVGKSILSMDTSLHDKKRWQQSRTQRPSYRNKPLWKTRRSLFKEIHRPFRPSTRNPGSMLPAASPLDVW